MKIIGTGADDDLQGSTGSDHIKGLGGDDFIFGGDGGHDAIDGGGGDDQIYSGPDASTLLGGAGADDLVGGAGADLIDGGAGADSLWGADGHDTVQGGAGDDVISDSAGQDLLDGGRGNDVLSLSYGDWTGHAAAGITFTFDSSGALQLTPGGSTAVNFERLDVFGGNGDDSFTGGNGSDTLIGWEGADTLHGGRGADLLSGSNGDDLVYGDKGNDILVGSGGSDILYGGSGDDTLIGGSAGDLYFGDDTLVGGAGADVFRGGLGTTSISYADSRQGVDVDLVAGRGYGGDAQGDVYVGGDAFYAIHGKVIGSAFDDVIVGGVSQYGGAGDDRLVTDQETQLMSGGAGRDVFVLDFAGDAQFYHPEITDFSQAEREALDVSGIDARVGTRGIDGFRFIGTAAFDGHAGEIRYEVDGNQTIVEMNVNKDPGADLTFVLDGHYALTAADFVL